jgi:hypothetical protein
MPYVYMSRKNVIWTKYGRLIIISDAEDGAWNRRFVLCKCECWNTKTIWLPSLKKWATKSCWCLNDETRKKWTHKMTHTKIYTIYKCLNNRCKDTKHKWYQYYWWKWIKNLRETFEEFYADMWPTYKEWLTLDRIDNNKNYYKENCKRSTRKEQSSNTSRTLRKDWMCLKDYCIKHSINYAKACREYKKTFII